MPTTQVSVPDNIVCRITIRKSFPNNGTKPLFFPVHLRPKVPGGALPGLAALLSILQKQEAVRPDIDAFRTELAKFLAARLECNDQRRLPELVGCQNYQATTLVDKAGVQWKVAVERLYVEEVPGDGD